ncbi:hypothetical protein BESB_012590 [Besnoitia besnoiti]|uniref:Protein kinase domain-containing protein n=1 Tax=Besnoitia besnoiti TaxID=94643 RepID=A0A2A9MAK6_BESBE|nr:hypothetical protein BESB_012590 [Besnoitia besnoiti]PFH32647.1 hypothetical protein BESB_012590 [Besnoitia besnoiti]
MAPAFLKRLVVEAQKTGLCLPALPGWQKRHRRCLASRQRNNRSKSESSGVSREDAREETTDDSSRIFDEEQGREELAALATEADASVFVMSYASRQVVWSLECQLPPQFLFECNTWRPICPRPPRVWLRRGNAIGLGTKSVFLEVGPAGSNDCPFAAKVFLISSNVIDIDRAFADPDYVDHARALVDKEVHRRMRQEFSIRRLTTQDDPLTLLSDQGLLVPLCWGIVTDLREDMIRVSPEMVATKFLVIYPRMACALGELPFDFLGMSAKLLLTKQCVNVITKFHANGCVHRDLSLDSFMLDFEGHVYLRSIRRAARYTGKPEGLVVPEDPLYLDPDTAISLIRQPQGRLVSMWSRDSWALGVILFVVWFNRLPYSLPEFAHGDPERKVRSLALLPFIERPLDDALVVCRSAIPKEVKELLAGLLRLRGPQRQSPEDISRTSPLFRYVRTGSDSDHGLPRTTPARSSFPALDLFLFQRGRANAVPPGCW